MFKYTYIDAINISIIIKCRNIEKKREKSFYIYYVYIHT